MKLEYDSLDGSSQFSMRTMWAQGLLFASYEVTVSFVLVIVSMSYYEKESSLTTYTDSHGVVQNITHTCSAGETREGCQTTSFCGSLLPNWQSVAALFSFYITIYLSIILMNSWYVKTNAANKAVNDEVKSYFILCHPYGRLVLGLFSFMLMCAFYSSSPKLRHVYNIAILLSQIGMVIDACFCVFFTSIIFRARNADMIDLGIKLWIGRNMVFTQLKYAMFVCFLSSHINVVVQALVIFLLNVVVYIMWSSMVKSNRSIKARKVGTIGSQ